ncbi:helix-turn-helix transcriptional regulator [Nonomuraea dietziae]|uniref:helix-turn-helix transcriptional regulator n=1 Tax=Nonomuraea dietziae TaxID=65515 RepID=UPI00343FCC41
MSRQNRQRPSLRDWLTIGEVCAELRVSRRSWDRWQAAGTGPATVRLASNGPIRIRRDRLDQWLGACTGIHEWLTVQEVCAELRVTRRTWARWRANETGPTALRIAGNGPVRVRRDWLDEWLGSEVAA